MAKKKSELEAEWERDGERWRSARQICSGWEEAASTPPELLKARVRGEFWGLLEELRITLLVTREYEHLALALSAPEGARHTSFFRVPHPSGIAVDRDRGTVHLASTRNPNVIYELHPVTGQLPRKDAPHRASTAASPARPLVPAQARFLPGCSYVHDLAFIGGELHANAVGENAVVRLSGSPERVWWPRCIHPRSGGFSLNTLQLNSIAAGHDLESSFFTASAERPSAKLPGQLDFPVDKQGVVFSGKTREVFTRGLTRPHSARLHRKKLWVLNSGYGELGVASERFTSALTLPGWTRGACFIKNYAFIGTSRVIPRFRQYAPGLDVDKSVCGVHAVDLKSGRVVGSIQWASGNQIFSVEWLPTSVSWGFPFTEPRLSARQKSEEQGLFYSFVTQGLKERV